MQKPLFSVIIPIYNTELYLRECIDSVINQNFHDYEIILVIDGSTDGSLKICYEYEKNHSTVRVINQTNMGPSIARNRAIDSSNGEYIIFLDSDDYWLKSNFLEVAAKKLEYHKSDIIFFGYNYVQSQTRFEYEQLKISLSDNNRVY